MPHLFRSFDGVLWKPSQTLSLKLADGTVIEGTWAGSAQEEKLDWWLRPSSGNKLTQTEEVSAVAIKADDTGDIIWGEGPPGARLFFVVEPAQPGKNYRLARMVTVAANPAQVAYFRHERFVRFGTLNPKGGIEAIPPLVPPPPIPKAQGELF